jgi:DNA-directed RNA polymerase specialized sigma24 family protein
MPDSGGPSKNPALSDTVSFGAIRDEAPSVAERILAGDPAGYAELYDGYATGLFAYCYNVLGDQDRAVGALGITFMIAASRLGELRYPDRLRPWLYTLARNECRRRAADGEAYDGAIAADGQRGRAYICTAAMHALSMSDREVLELSLRHQFAGSDLAEVLGIPNGYVYPAVTQAGSRLRLTLGALLVAYFGRQDCADLNGMLAGWDGEYIGLVSQRVHRHIEWCETCQARVAQELPMGSLTDLLAMAAPPPMPPGLRDDVLALLAQVTSGDADLIVGRVELEHQARTARTPGTSRAASRRWRINHPLPIAGVVVVLLVAGILVYLLGVKLGGSGGTP